MKLKELSPWDKSYDQYRQRIKKQRHYYADKDLYNQSYDFSSSFVWVWEMDHKGWELKNWCFWTVCVSCSVLSHSATPGTLARQASLSMGFSRQEYWSGLPFPSPGDLPTQGPNLGLLHCRQILYHGSHQGSPANSYPFWNLAAQDLFQSLIETGQSFKVILTGLLFFRVSVLKKSQKPNETKVLVVNYGLLYFSQIMFACGLIVSMSTSKI